MSKELICASNNEDKLREYRQILEPYGISVISQAEAGFDIDVEETGDTYIANARLKADALYSAAHRAVFADDSGIEVEALGNGPGVYSHRYAEPGQHCKKMLSDMADVPAEKRGARYVTHIHYIDENGVHYDFEGECKGRIANSPRGKNGFCYDYIFEASNGKTYAEMTSSEKNGISGRWDASQKMIKAIASLGLKAN